MSENHTPGPSKELYEALWALVDNSYLGHDEDGTPIIIVHEDDMDRARAALDKAKQQT